MPYRNRLGPYVAALTVGAIFVFWSLAVWQISQNQERTRAAGDQARSESEQDFRAQLGRCAALAGSEQVDCIVGAIEAQRDHDRAEDDLQAQQQMADWAFLMVAVSAAQLLIAGYGVVYIIKTFSQTSDAVEAAQDAVRVTQDIGQRQLRAYIDITTAEIESRESTGTAHTVVAKVTLKNGGMTPAYDVRCWVLASIRPIPPVVAFENGDPILSGNYGAGTIHNLRVRQAFNDGHVAALKAESMGLYVWGKVIYSDAFSVSHTMLFNLVSTGTSFTDGKFRPYYLTLTD